MITSSFGSPAVGRMAWATGLASVLATIFIVLFYTSGGPFGTLNDIFNGVAGILSGVLIWMLYINFPLCPSALNRTIFILAVIASLLVVMGSFLIILDITGWLLAGWYTTAGNALIGICVLVFNYFAKRAHILPGRLTTFGFLAGTIMAEGILVFPGIFLGIDSMELSPWFIDLGLLSYVGSYLLYPVWALWLGRTILSR